MSFWRFCDSDVGLLAARRLFRARVVVIIMRPIMYETGAFDRSFHETSEDCSSVLRVTSNALLGPHDCEICALVLTRSSLQVCRSNREDLYLTYLIYA